jgi:predicted homoserine dehydrogenase-like protein
MCEKRYLPQGLVAGCKLKRDIPQDEVICYDDVDLPAGRLADQLRAEQYKHFRGETWLDELVKRSAGGSR